MSIRKLLRPVKLRAKELLALGIEKVKPAIIDRIPHDPDAFTQGLFLHDGWLYESTGLEGRSSIREIDPATGEINRMTPVKGVWAEGLAIINQKIYQLTWKSRLVNIFDLEKMLQIDSLPYPNQGWGMSVANDQLLVSNGSSSVELRDEQFALKEKLKITMNGIPLSLINDLDVYRGDIFFNVFRHRRIYQASLNSGMVKRIYDFSDVAKDEYRMAASRLDHDELDNVMLNGIAIDQNTGTAYITGKLWSNYYTFPIEKN